MRLAQPEDRPAILDLLRRAFAPSPYEADLVRSLIGQSRAIHHWVETRDQRVVAYLCYSQAFRDSQPIGWHLAPVAVDPTMQGSGLGSSLILESLADAALVNASIFVLGDPAYYQRFGFEVVPEPRCPFDPSNEHFMALRYAGEDGFVIGYETDFG